MRLWSVMSLCLIVHTCRLLDSFEFLAVNAYPQAQSSRGCIYVSVLPPLVMFSHPDRSLSPSLSQCPGPVLSSGTAFKLGSTSLFSPSRGPSSYTVRTRVTLKWYHLSTSFWPNHSGHSFRSTAMS